MHRPNLNDLPAEERSLLADLIQQYTTPDIIELHRDAVLSGVHSDPEGFLSFHRSYIGGLESFLSEQGYPQWVPLPAWNPANPVPEEFNIPSTGPDRLRNLNPDVSFSPEFDPENLVNFETVTDLGEAIIPRHNLVHERIGGVMNNFLRAPEAPIFWPFHSFIDDIWWNWQRITVAVPSCIGLTFANAEKKLSYCGLHTVTVKKMFFLTSRVKHQNPAPLTMTPYGSTVKLFI